MPGIKANIFFRVIDDTTRPILDSLRQAHLSVKIWLSGADAADYCVRRRVRDIESIETDGIGRHPACYLWDIGSESASRQDSGLGHMLARTKCFGTSFICVDNKKHPCNQIVLFHDCDYLAKYPDTFHKIKVFDSFDSLKAYIDGVPDPFGLADNPRFSRTRFVEQGQPVYSEPSTGRYWYLDNLHKNHYEVFDHSDHHLGEADSNGSLDMSKRDKDKSIKF